MKATLLAWAQAKTLLGFDQVEFEFDPSERMTDVIDRVCGDAAALQFCRVAVNHKIHDWQAPIGQAFEVALIPPVSGG